MAAKKLFYAFLSLSLGLFLSTAAIPAEMKKPPEGAESASTVKKLIAAIQVSFKVEAITPQSFYMGEVWAAKLKGAQEGKKFTAEAKAVGLDSQGNQMDITPVWKAGDPAMIDISPDQGSKVKLTILKPGRSFVTVAFAGISKKLPLKAWYRDKIMHVEITQ